MSNYHQTGTKIARSAVDYTIYKTSAELRFYPKTTAIIVQLFWMTNASWKNPKSKVIR